MCEGSILQAAPLCQPQLAMHANDSPHSWTFSSASAAVLLTNQFPSLLAVFRLINTKATMLSKRIPAKVLKAKALMTGFGSRRSFWYILTGRRARSADRCACERMYIETSERICMLVELEVETPDEEMELDDEERHCTTWGKKVNTGRPFTII